MVKVPTLRDVCQHVCNAYKRAVSSLAIAPSYNKHLFASTFSPLQAIQSTTNFPRMAQRLRGAAVTIREHNY